MTRCSKSFKYDIFSLAVCLFLCTACVDSQVQLNIQETQVAGAIYASQTVSAPTSTIVPTATQTPFPTDTATPLPSATVAPSPTVTPTPTLEPKQVTVLLEDLPAGFEVIDPKDLDMDPDEPQDETEEEAISLVRMNTFAFLESKQYVFVYGNVSYLKDDLSRERFGWVFTDSDNFFYTLLNSDKDIHFEDLSRIYLGASFKSKAAGARYILNLTKRSVKMSVVILNFGKYVATLYSEIPVDSDFKVDIVTLAKKLDARLAAIATMEP